MEEDKKGETFNLDTSGKYENWFEPLFKLFRSLGPADYRANVLSPSSVAPWLWDGFRFKAVCFCVPRRICCLSRFNAFPKESLEGTFQMMFSSGAECVRAISPHWLFSLARSYNNFWPQTCGRHELNGNFWFLKFPYKRGLTYSLQIQIIQRGADTWKEEMIDEMGYRRAFVQQTR